MTTVARLPLEQVTLGGEPVDQSILDRLTELFPTARVSWIYASSEAGASIAVHDGRAGFPVSWLDRSARGRPRLSVADGELLIESDWSAEGFAGALRTGDRAEVVGDRVHITGRIASDEINVGGPRPPPRPCAGCCSHTPTSPGPRSAAGGRRSSAPSCAADLVLDQPPVRATAELTRWCADRLPDHAVPRRIRLLDEIPIKETLKSDV